MGISKKFIFYFPLQYFFLKGLFTYSKVIFDQSL